MGCAKPAGRGNGDPSPRRNPRSRCTKSALGERCSRRHKSGMAARHPERLSAVLRANRSSRPDADISVRSKTIERAPLTCMFSPSRGNIGVSRRGAEAGVSHAQGWQDQSSLRRIVRPDNAWAFGHHRQGAVVGLYSILSSEDRRQEYLERARAELRKESSNAQRPSRREAPRRRDRRGRQGHADSDLRGNRGTG
jgi:hypothetical protein